MFNIEVTFDRNAWNREELESAKYDLLVGMSHMDIIERYDDFGLCDAAAIDCAMELGWNMKEFMKEEIMELLYSYFDFDGETTVSLNRLIVTEAMSYIEEHTGAASYAENIDEFVAVVNAEMEKPYGFAAKCCITYNESCDSKNFIFAICEHSDGWDYYLFDNDYHSITDGIWDDPDTPAGEVARDLLTSEGLWNGKYTIEYLDCERTIEKCQASWVSVS